MAWSQSFFLQALGWATLNSLWQMALLWCFFLAASQLFKLSASQKYLAAVVSVCTGAIWFMATLLFYYQKGSFPVNAVIKGGETWTPAWHAVLSSASLAYLLLLVIPLIRLIRSGRFLLAIQKKGLHKAPVEHRIFVQQASALLGLRKKVLVHLSSLVTSPVTIGFLKPVILIPVAALTHLSPLQLEAILLHELAHIRRHDYLINLLLSGLQVLLYFNPFVHFFLKAIDRERESCCDDLVLQFQYDRLAYASALLQLEKVNYTTVALAMGATHRSHLMHRIEKIVGIKKKPKPTISLLLAPLGTLLIFLALHSVTPGVNNKKEEGREYGLFAISYLQFTNAPALSAQVTERPNQRELKNTIKEDLAAAPPPQPGPEMAPDLPPDLPEAEAVPMAPQIPPHYTHVAFDGFEISLSEAEKAQIKATVENTKKLLAANWPLLLETIPDGILPEERLALQQEYLKEIEKVNWLAFEQHLKATYNHLDWERINQQIYQQLAGILLDSVFRSQEASLELMESVHAENSVAQPQPLPDVSVQEIARLKQELKAKVKAVKKDPARKTIRL